MIKTNFHTHTVYCDGADKPEDIINEAIKKGFIALGFSGHSYLEKDADFVMSEEEAAFYRREINLLKDKYKNEIKIYCGIEQDYYSETPIIGYDYVIGSVHSVLKDGEYLWVDQSPEALKENLIRYYDGDFDAFAEDYFSLVEDVVNKTNADIIGHIDLILKYSEKMNYIPTERFLNAAKKAVKALVKYARPFEINTGAIARGARSIPYPIPEILKMIKEYGGKIVFSSDCHDKNFLDCAFDKAEALAKQCGFEEHGVITEEGIEYIPII